MGTGSTRRAEALTLSEQLLGEIELSALSPTDIARKASRLARLLDDGPAMRWLHFEVAGYPDALDSTATQAAIRSNRIVTDRTPKPGDGPGPYYWTQTLGDLTASIEASKLHISAATDPQVSLSSANPHQHIFAPKGNNDERWAVRNLIARQQATLDRIVGSIHTYVTERYQELRFGAAVETAFEVVRQEVDTNIGELVPDALPMLSAAFENATSDNPEHWASAAGTSRRLLKAVADSLRPPGPDVGGRKMGDGNYINRLVDWIMANSDSGTAASMVTSDLEYLGKRLDAADGAGQKGAHASVTRIEASRFITGTYLVLGDVLGLASGRETAEGGASQGEEHAQADVGGDVAFEDASSQELA
jgi:AbiTii-like protein